MNLPFMFPIIAAVILSPTISPAHADDQLKLPKSPPPEYVIARLNKKGNLLVDRSVSVVRVEKKSVTKIRNGKKVIETISMVVPYRNTQTLLMTLTQVEIYRGANEKLSAEDIRDELEMPRAVMMTTDGNKLDPFYLRLVKPTALIIVNKHRNQVKKKAK